MDWAQFPYRSTARVHDGPDAPLVRLQWYPTDLPFLPIDKQTVITNRIWWTDDVADVKVGELPVGENGYDQKTPAVPIKGLTGKHICYPQWLEVGEPWPNDLPPNEYTENGIPVCCMGNANAVLGGVEVGGEVGERIVYVDPASGGVEVGGEVGERIVYVDPASGGVEVGGEVGDDWGYNDAASGGVEVGGSAGNVSAYTDATSGGVEVGGETGERISYVDSASGGVDVGGGAGDVLRYVDGAEGGAESGGEAGDTWQATDSTLGGVVIGGEAGDMYDGGGDPGNTCATALGVSLGFSGEYGGLTDVEYWFALTVEDFGSVNIEASSDGPEFQFTFYSGICSSLDIIYETTTSNVSHTIDDLEPGVYYIRIVPSANLTYTIHLF